MPTHSLLPEARLAAIEAAFDEALAEVRAAGDVALLQECRSIFRQRVPLNLRAYVAAALALKCAGTVKTKDKFSRRSPSGKDAHQKRSGSDEGKVGRQAEKSNAPEREPRAVRENRYRGEGVTIFVSAGRRQRFYARIAIKLLLDIPGVADEQIGDIRTMDNYSFIVIDPAVEDAVIALLDGYDFKGRTLAANRARKRGEPAPTKDEPGYSDSLDTNNDESGLPELEAFGSGPIEDHDDDSYGVQGNESEYDPTEDA